MSEECRVCKGTRKIKWDMSEDSKPYIVYVHCPFCKTKEAIMSDKLTKESLQEWFDTVERINGARPDALAVWAKIEADREAIRAEVLKEVMTPPFLNKKENEAYHKWAIEQARAETREELLKTHFKLGEWLEMTDPFDERNKIVQVLPVFNTNEVQHAGLGVRRPPKKRAKTDEEMLNNVIYRLETWEAVARGLTRLGSLTAVCRDLGIDTEVDE